MILNFSPLFISFVSPHLFVFIADNIYCYDAATPFHGMLRGVWAYGKMVACTFQSTIANQSNHAVKSNGKGEEEELEEKKSEELLIARDNAGAVRRYDPSTEDSISSSPLSPDEWEHARVVVGQSEIEGGGEGLYARVSLKKGELISFYNGTRPNVKLVDRRHWDMNSNAITIVDEENTCIDVPDPYDKTSHYCASLCKLRHVFI